MKAIASRTREAAHNHTNLPSPPEALMSWIQKEIKKRAKQTQNSLQPSQIDTTPGAVKMADLWSAIEAANNALPSELKLQATVDPSVNILPGAPIFIAGLRAPNGAGIGFTGEAIRYTWPERSKRASYNFWIRWKMGEGYTLTQRTKLSATTPVTLDRTFNPKRVEYMVKCLVMGTRIKPGSTRKRRLWFF